jgi:hypothetical protein
VIKTFIDVGGIVVLCWAVALVCAVGRADRPRRLVREANRLYLFLMSGVVLFAGAVHVFFAG